MEKDKENYIGKGSTLDAHILHALMDGENHTHQELADKFEVSKTTVRRSIERLRMRYNIHSFSGGAEGSRGGGGIYLDEQHLYFGLTRESVRKTRKEYKRV